MEKSNEENHILRKEPISNINDRLVKCRYCHKDVKLRVLPIHENFCKESKPEEYVEPDQYQMNELDYDSSF